MNNKQKETNRRDDIMREMISDYGIKVESMLSNEQGMAIELFKKGENILIMGSGGTGKSKMIEEIEYETRRGIKNIVVTATTGISAYNINGLTIYSYMGIGTGEKETDVLIRNIKKKNHIVERLRMLDILVIDEISMMSASIFEKIEEILKTIRRIRKPFGGVQVVLLGDLLQLLPIFNNITKRKVEDEEEDTRLIVESERFRECFRERNTIRLEKNFRQSDIILLGILERIRVGKQEENDIKKLKERLIVNLEIGKDELKDAVYLVSSNRQANEINTKKMEKINEKEIKYIANFEDIKKDDESNEIRNDMERQFKQKGTNEIILKKGARVMLTKNIDTEIGLVNGATGTIIELKGRYPIIKFDNGEKRQIEETTWDIEDKRNGDVIVTAKQIPLILCWAITIHKSQSLTLEKAVMDLRDCFCEHQVYVALSRVRSLSGLYLVGLNEKKIKVNEKIIRYLRSST